MSEVSLVIGKDLIWQSDWNGYEVGFDDVPIVSLYILKGTGLNFYIDIQTMKILDGWKEEE